MCSLDLDWHIGQVTFETELAEESHPLTLFVSTFKPKSECSFIVTVYTTAPLAHTDGTFLQRIPNSVAAK